MEQEKIIKLTLASQIAAQIIPHYLDKEDAVDITINLTKQLVDGLYERI